MTADPSESAAVSQKKVARWWRTVKTQHVRLNFFEFRFKFVKMFYAKLFEDMFWLAEVGGRKAFKIIIGAARRLAHAFLNEHDKSLALLCDMSNFNL